MRKFIESQTKPYRAPTIGTPFARHLRVSYVDLCLSIGLAAFAGLLELLANERLGRAVPGFE